MNTNRTLGYIFLVLAILLTLAILGSLPKIVVSMMDLFSEKTNGIESGRSFGTFLGWLIQIALTIALWKFGLKWTQKTRPR